jgi:hypothetical protein
MSIASAASAAVATFPWVNVTTPFGAYALPVVMVAIAGAETGGTYDDAAAGDFGLGGPSCNGATSWGLWQIHNVHAQLLTQLSGSSDPCAWASWLSNAANCARAALAVYQSQGLGAWTTWNEGTYSGWLPAAQKAVTAAAPTPLPQPTTSQVPGWVYVGLGLVGAVLAGAGIEGYEELRRAHSAATGARR